MSDPASLRTKNGSTMKPKAFRPLYPYLKPYRLSFILSLASVVFSAAGIMALGKGLRQIVDEGMLQQPQDYFWGGLGVVCLLAIATFGRTCAIASIGEQVVRDIRQDLFHRLLHMPAVFFEQWPVGDIMARLHGDLSLIQILMSQSLVIIVRNTLLIAGAMAMMLGLSWKLTLYTLLIIPVIALPVMLWGRKTRQKAKGAQSALGDAAAFGEEVLSNIRTVQIFSHQGQDQQIFRQFCHKSCKAAQDSAKARASLSIVMMFVVFAGVCILLACGRTEMLEGQISSGDLSSFLFFMLIAASSMGSLSSTMGDIMRSRGAAERISDLLAHLRPHPTNSAFPNASRTTSVHALPRLAERRGIIAMHQISFAYPANPSKLVLDNVSFSVHPGEMVAIVGPSGAGKSTIFSLLLGLYDPQKGNIFIEGNNSRQLNIEHIRAHLSLVTQEPVIFSASVYENLIYGNPTASVPMARDALHAVDMADFVDSLPEGIHTQVGVRGVRLSGGQKQRLAIARVLLRDTPVILFDEATNSLDAHSEQVVQKNLEQISRERTTIVIAHRLSTVLKANRILVLDHGKVQAIGNHGELMGTSPLYRHLAALQFQAGG